MKALGRHTIIGVVALAIVSGERGRAGQKRGIRWNLPDGCRQERKMGIDSAVGSLLCRNDTVEIHYDIGLMAGDYCKNVDTSVVRLGAQGPLVQVCGRVVGDDNASSLVIVGPSRSANFWVAWPKSTDVVVFMDVVRSVLSE